MDLSIIIVSWNVQEKLKKNLEEIFKSKDDIDFEVFVVDNNSSDKSVEMIKEKFPQVTLIVNKENLGFAKANNQAMEKTKGDFILLLNPDMRVNYNTLSNMIHWMRKNKQADVAGCFLVDEKNNIVRHIRRFPTVFDQLAIILKLPHLFPFILNKYLRADFNYEKETKVDSIRGGFFMIRKENIKNYFLDDRYFIWFEEVDFCKKIKEEKGQVWYTPCAKCVDYVGQSFKQVDNLKKQKYFKDSMLKYFKKWHPRWQYLILTTFWPFSFFLVKVGNFLKIKKKAKT